MSNTLAGGIQVVEVTTGETDDRGRPVKEQWVAATSREKAVATVLAIAPEGSKAELSPLHILPDHAARLKLRPGEAKRANS
jgi:hypothetical protein